MRPRQETHKRPRGKSRGGKRPEQRGAEGRDQRQEWTVTVRSRTNKNGTEQNILREPWPESGDQTTPHFNMDTHYELNEERFVALLTKLIGEAKFVQNMPPRYVCSRVLLQCVCVCVCVCVCKFCACTLGAALACRTVFKLNRDAKCGLQATLLYSPPSHADRVQDKSRCTTQKNVCERRKSH